MRIAINIFLIIFVVATVYTLRGDIVPALTKIQNFAQDTVVRVLGDKKAAELDNSVKNTVSGILDSVEESIIAPGPLKSSQGGKLGDSQNVNNSDIVYWTNKARKDNGALRALTPNVVLNEMAMKKVNDMFTKQYFEHESPSGVTVSNLAKETGYAYILIGENLALGTFGTSQAIVTAWMQSPGHRANILNGKYIEIGVAAKKGTYDGREVWIAVQHFGLPQSVCPAIDHKLKAQIDINQAQIAALKTQIDDRKMQIDKSDQSITYEYNNLVDGYNAFVREYNALVASTKIQIATYNEQINSYNTCVVAQ
jgi:uncharacterized protein YkwD